jgi:hypothetical protein
MERFKVKGQELRDFYQENTNLKRVFSDIENDLRSTNQVVCRYIINGLELDEADELRFSDVSLNEVDTLEYLTENSRDLVGSVLEGWIEALPELMQETDKLSRRMRAQGMSGLFKPIHDLVHNIEFLIDSVVSIKQMLGDHFLASTALDWDKVEKQSKKTVEEALHALQNKDFVLLADVLEYDLINALQMWQQHLQILERSSHGEHAGSSVHESESQHSGSNPMGRKRFAN